MNENELDKLNELDVASLLPNEYFKLLTLIEAGDPHVTTEILLKAMQYFIISSWRVPDFLARIAWSPIATKEIWLKILQDYKDMMDEVLPKVKLIEEHFEWFLEIIHQISLDKNLFHKIIESSAVTSVALLEVVRHKDFVSAVYEESAAEYWDHRSDLLLEKVIRSKALTAELLLEILQLTSAFYDKGACHLNNKIKNLFYQIIESSAVNVEVLVEILQQTNAFYDKNLLFCRYEVQNLFYRIIESSVVNAEILLKVVCQKNIYKNFYSMEALLGKIIQSKAATAEALLEILQRTSALEEDLYPFEEDRRKDLCYQIIASSAVNAEVLLEVIRHKYFNKYMDNKEKNHMLERIAKHPAAVSVMLTYALDYIPGMIVPNWKEIYKMVANNSYVRNDEISSLCNLFCKLEIDKAKGNIELPYVSILPFELIHRSLIFCFGGQGDQLEEVSMLRTSKKAYNESFESANARPFKLIKFSEYADGVKKSMEKVIEERPNITSVQSTKKNKVLKLS